MQFYYGDKMPLRVLDEIDFWKLQEAEHTVVIRELTSNLEQRFVEALQLWEQALSQSHGMVKRYIETLVRTGAHVTPAVYQQVMQFTDAALRQSQQFILFLNTLGTESEAIRGNPTAVVVLNHIRRESEYFIGIAQAVLQGR